MHDQCVTEKKSQISLLKLAMLALVRRLYC